MDDDYAVDRLRQNLLDACERESGVSLGLQAAHREKEELQHHVLEYRRKYQELDDALEAEELKTHDEYLARKEAEDLARLNHAELLKSKRNEEIANEHCEAAEAEFVRLDGELATEREARLKAEAEVRQQRDEVLKLRESEEIANGHCDAAEEEFIRLRTQLAAERAAADALAERLRDEVEQAETKELEAYDLLSASRARVCALLEELGGATERITMLESELRTKDSEEEIRKAKRHLMDAESGLSIVAHELERTGLSFYDLMEEYNALKARCSGCGPAVREPSAADAHHGGTVDAKRGSSKVLGTVKAALGAGKDNPLEMPAAPQPAVLRPALAEGTANQAEILKTTGRRLPLQRRTETRNLRWKLFWRANSWNLFFQGLARR